MKFLNKFVKECDDVSLKINRFTAAVMPPNEKQQNKNTKRDDNLDTGDKTQSGSIISKKSGKQSAVKFNLNEGIISKNKS